MVDEDLLPQRVRLVTDDGLRFLASYRGLLNFATNVRDRGGPNSAAWGAAVRNVTQALDANDETVMNAALKSFKSAARSEGWYC